MIVASFVTNHGILIAAGANAVTFTSAAGDELVVTFSNQFPPIGAGEPTQPRERPEQGSGATTTTATGGSTDDDHDGARRRHDHDGARRRRDHDADDSSRRWGDDDCERARHSGTDDGATGAADHG